MKVWQTTDLGAGYAKAEGKISKATLSIEAGERVALLGPERDGRAILFRVLAGLRPVRAGEMDILGWRHVPVPFYVDWDGLVSRTVRRAIGVSMATEGLLSNVTVQEGMELLLRFKYGESSELMQEGVSLRVTKICEKFQLAEAKNKRPESLTGSERRLASLALAYLTSPMVMALEEPSLHIGDSQLDLLWSLLDEIAAPKERTLLISTDDWAVAAHFCPRWIVCEDAQIIYDGPSKEFLATNHRLARQCREQRKTRQKYEKILGEVA